VEQYTAAVWVGVALLASLISIRLGISVALMEIFLGFVAGNFGAYFGSAIFQPNSWINFLAGFGSVVLTFLAGAEIEPEAFRRQLKPSLPIGVLSFLFPFLGALGFTYYVTGWNLQAAQIYDPLLGHPEHLKSIDNADMRETVKELARLDGAFVVSDEGIVLSACRYLNASSEGINLLLGLGSRHVAAASMTRETQAIAVVVSESSVVRVFENGALIEELIPEVWVRSRCRAGQAWLGEFHLSDLLRG
jgi:DNA integrity scanning protein DisA with diadenylate cyclase activity